MNSINILDLVKHIPWAYVAPVLAFKLIPYLSTLVSTKRSGWTGLVTQLLSIAAAFFGSLSTGHFNASAALGTAVLTWALSTKEDRNVLQGTPTEAKLLAFPKPGWQSAQPPAPTDAAPAQKVA